MNDAFINVAAKVCVELVEPRLSHLLEAPTSPTTLRTIEHDFKDMLSKRLTCFHALEESLPADRTKVFREVRDALTRLLTRFRLRHPLDACIREFEDAVREALTPKLF